MNIKFLGPVAIVFLLGCSGNADVTSHNWTCQDLVEQVVAMSQDQDAKILEITNVEELNNSPGYRLECRGNAEWSQGYGMAKFGAHVSDGGSIIVEYSR